VEQEADRHRIALTVPALPDYVVLARLALSAVAGRTSLSADEVADLKLAITEGASLMVADDSPHRLTFTFTLGEDLEVEIGGPPELVPSDGERELSRAIIQATVDDCGWRGTTLWLLKRLRRPGPDGPTRGE
jgi:hypothetical protein